MKAIVRLYKWWENEKELKLADARLVLRIDMCEKLEAIVIELKAENKRIKAENQRMREIICGISDKKLKELIND